MANTLGKNRKLCGEERINQLFERGSSMMAYPFRIVWRVVPETPSKGMLFVVAVPKKKIKHAVDRNRIKRLSRECIRLYGQSFHQRLLEKNLTVEMAFIWIPTEVFTMEKIQKKMVDAFSKMDIQLAELAIINSGG